MSGCLPFPSPSYKRLEEWPITACSCKPLRGISGLQIRLLHFKITCPTWKVAFAISCGPPLLPGQTACQGLRHNALDQANVNITVAKPNENEKNCLGEFLPVLGVNIKKGGGIHFSHFPKQIYAYCSVTSMESSCRDLLNYKVEHKSILKKKIKKYGNTPVLFLHT